MEELIKQIQDGFSELSGNFLEKLSSQSEVIIKYVAPIVEKQFDAGSFLAKNGVSFLDRIKDYATSLVPAEGLTFDELLDLIAKVTDADKLQKELLSGVAGKVSGAATKTAAEILSGGANEK